MFEEFVKAVEETFDLTVDARVQPVDVAGEPPADRPRPKDISAVMSFTGGYHGTVILSFPSQVAAQIVERIIGEVTVDDEETADAVSEFLNMISGAAKRLLARSGHKIEMSLPTVVIGRDHNVFARREKSVMRIDFESDLGSFYIQMALKQLVRPTKILLTDASRLSRRILKNALSEGFEKTEFIECVDGTSARRTLDDIADDVDLVIVDFHLPQFSSLELLRSIRSVPGKPRIPVLIVTSDHTAARQVQELETQHNVDVSPCGLLLKPFNADEARSIARALVEAGAKQGAVR